MDEQLSIVVYIQQSIASLDLSIGRAEREIALIREYRTRLIADVVTGKLDFRHLASALGELPAEDADPSEADEDLGVGLDDAELLDPGADLDDDTE